MAGMVLSEGAYVNNAINVARAGMNSAIAQARRSALKYGVDPSSGKYQALERSAMYDAAAQQAAAGTEASFNWLKEAQKADAEADQLQYQYDKLEAETNLEQQALDLKKKQYYDAKRAAKDAASDYRENSNRYEAKTVYDDAGKAHEYLFDKNGKLVSTNSNEVNYYKKKKDKTITGASNFYENYNNSIQIDSEHRLNGITPY